MTARRLADLRTALAGLDSAPGELVRVREEIPARFGVGARYARWAGTPAAPPTGPGPVVLFEHVTADSGASGPVLMGLYGTRRRAAALLGLEPAEVPFRLLEAVDRPVPPVLLAEDSRPERAARPADLTALPIPVLTDADAGPYLTLGAVLATDPDTGVRNLSVHRMCVQGPDTLTIWMVPGRDLERAYNAALARGESLPVAIHLGAAARGAPGLVLPVVAGAPGGGRDRCGRRARRRARGADCRAGPSTPSASRTPSTSSRARSWTRLVPENPAGPFATPEFLGYRGRAHPALPVIRVPAITARRGRDPAKRQRSRSGAVGAPRLRHGGRGPRLPARAGAPIAGSALPHRRRRPAHAGPAVAQALRRGRRGGPRCREAVLETFRMASGAGGGRGRRPRVRRGPVVGDGHPAPGRPGHHDPAGPGRLRAGPVAVHCLLAEPVRRRPHRQSRTSTAPSPSPCATASPAQFTPEPAAGARRQAARRPR